jgi:HEAT repeat protein
MADPTLSRAPSGPPPAPDGSLVEVQGILLGIARAVRAHKLYEGSSPVFDRFVGELHRRIAEFWGRRGSLELDVSEYELRWEDQVVYHSDDRNESLSFLFHRDGLRRISLHPGFEGHDLTVFLELVARVYRRYKSEEDDLITLLWEHELTHLQYEFVDVLVEGAEPPHGGDEPPPEVAPAAVREDARDRPAETVSEEDFEESLYFLDEAELRVLTQEVRLETQRDLWTDVCHALLDRLEDGAPERRDQIVRTVRQSLPHLLGTGKLLLVASVLESLRAAAGQPDLPQSARATVEGIFADLGRQESIEQLVQFIEDQPAAHAPEAVAAFAEFFPPSALAVFLRAHQAATHPDVRRVHAAAIERLVSLHPTFVVRLLASADAAVAVGAAGWVARLGLSDAAPGVVRLLERPEPEVRLAAVTALQELRTSVAAGALQQRLEDADRDVRIAAAKALAALRYTPAAPRFRDMVLSRRTRDADVTERIAIFESYGVLAGGEAVPVLDRILNGRSWVGRRDAPDMRACAALGLGQVRTAEAEAALQRAAAEVEPVVRSAVSRALRGIPA